MRIHETSEKTTSAYYSSPERSFYSGNHDRKIQPVSFTFDYRHKKGTDPKCTAPSMFPHYDIHVDEDDEDEEREIGGEQKHPYHVYHKNESSNWVMIFRSGLKPFSVQRWPVVTTYILMAIMFLIISGELLLSQQATNEFMELEPFNLMLGPSIQILVQSGARYPPCMRPIEAMPPNDRFVCLNTTLSVMDANWTAMKKATSGGSSRSDKPPPLGILDPIIDNSTLLNSSCSLQDVCGMRDFSSSATPDQSFRFFTSLFVHSGVIHYLLNVLLLWLFATDLEKVMNPIRFACG